MPARQVAIYDYKGIGANDYVAQRIREARRESGMNQTEVGKRLVPPRTYAAVSYIEIGKTAITVDLLMCFAVLFDKPLTWFLPGFCDAVAAGIAGVDIASES
jgi:transcriptional regulator with XRE-family HTH domain